MILTKRLFCCLLLSYLFLAAASPLEQQKYWVFFRDKGNATLAKGSVAWREAENRLSPRALARRAKVMPAGRLITEEDLPIAAEYRAALESRGFEIIHESRWLNSVSILAAESQIAALRELAFVKEVRRVAPLKTPPEPEANAVEPPPLLFKAAAHRLDYGSSLTQNEQIKVTTLHDAGINGSGVLVGMMDSGFHWQDHDAFQHLQDRILGERDFVNGDNVTRNQPGDPGGQDSHGTQTFSALGGFMPGQLIGPGYGASFLLAKTENIASETHNEEDFWAAAIEWMEGLGVDVTSTSLGYSEFDSGQPSYTTADMDGNTTIITKAAELASSRGVVVVNSAGNEGPSPTCSWCIITAPADGPNVIAVGAVTAAGTVVGFSGRGPTADGRIKPDVMAMGSSVRLVNPGNNVGYTNSSGTSFSCPLIGGVVAQILSAHPDLTPPQVMEALRNTASRATAPDNDYGYGIVDAKAAITYWGPAFSNVPEVEVFPPNELKITARILSTAGLQSNQTSIHYAIGASTNFTPVAMTQIDSISYVGNIPQAAANDTIKIYFAAREINAGTDVTYPKNAPVAVLRILGSGTVVDVDDPKLPGEFAVLHSFPNPARIDAATTIRFQLAKTGAVSVKVFNLLGQEVAALAINRSFETGKFHDLSWNGRDFAGKQVPSGVYFYQLAAGSQRVTRKILLLP